MKKHFLLIHFALFAYYFSSGQSIDSLRYKYNNQTIYRYGGSFLKGNEQLTFKELSQEFSKSDLGLDLYTKAKRYKTTSKILNHAGIITGIAAVSVLANHGNRNTALLLYGGYFVLFTTGMRYASLSTKNLDRALWQRNKDLLFPGRQE